MTTMKICDNCKKDLQQPGLIENPRWIKLQMPNGARADVCDKKCLDEYSARYYSPELY